MGAIGLIGGAFILLLAGNTSGIGSSFRSAVEPALRSVRDRTTCSRSDLADRSVLVSIGFATGEAVTGHLLVAVILGFLLWRARPGLRRLMSQENKILAAGGTFSADVAIGFYLPVVAAQVLLHNLFLAASLLSVVVALCWPPGGGQTIPGRSWKLAPVTS